MKYHPVVQKIRDLLESSGIEYKFFEHDAVRTSEEAAEVRPEYSLEQGAKALVIRTKDASGEHKFAMAVIPADRKLDSKKLRKALGVKKISFANAEESFEITEGVEFGGVPPFGNLFELEVVVDPALLEHQEIIFNCGDRKASISMNSKDYKALVKPLLEPLT